MKYLILLASLALVGCSSSDDEASGDTVGAEIAEDYNNAIDKARDVEDLLQESKENIDAALAEADEAIEEE